MLQATPKNWFSSSLTVADDGVHVADIAISSWRERGSFSLAGTPYSVHRERLMGAAFLLSAGDSVVARANQPSMFQRTLVIESQGREYTLRPKSAFMRQFLLEEQSRVIGCLSPASALTRKIDADLAESLPQPLALFLLCLTAIMWRRDAQAHSM